jgi:hypothetical protein
MDKQTDILPPGQHPYDPAKTDIDAVGFALHHVQISLAWINEHRASLEKFRNIDPARADSDLSNLRVCIRDAMIHLQRLSELILAGYTIDPNKRLPESLERRWFSSCVERMLAAESENRPKDNL